MGRVPFISIGTGYIISLSLVEIVDSSVFFSENIFIILEANPVVGSELTFSLVSCLFSILDDFIGVGTDIFDKDVFVGVGTDVFDKDVFVGVGTDVFDKDVFDKDVLVGVDTDVFDKVVFVGVGTVVFVGSDTDLDSLILFIG